MLLVVIGIMSFSLFSAPEAKTANEIVSIGIANVLNLTKSNILEPPKAQFGLYKAEGGATEKKGGGAVVVIIIVVIIGLVGGGIFLYKKKSAAGGEDGEFDHDFDDLDDD